MGGSKKRRNDPANVVCLCHAHHEEVTMHRATAYIEALPWKERGLIYLNFKGEEIGRRMLPSCEGGEQLTAERNTGPDSVSSSSSQGAGETGSVANALRSVIGADPSLSPAPGPGLLISDDGRGTPGPLMDAGVVRLPSFTPSTPASSLCQEGMQLLYWGLRIKGATDEWRWAVGDLILRMEEVYNESAYQFLEPLKEAFGYDALRQYRMVAAAVTQVTRELAPTWSHARAVASLDVEAQGAALATARGEHLSTRDLALLVRPTAPERERHRCPLCQHEHYVTVSEEWK